MHTLVDNSAKMAFERTSATLRLPELEYLLLNLPVQKDHLARYRLTKSVISESPQNGTVATALVPPNKTLVSLRNMTHSSKRKLVTCDYVCVTIIQNYIRYVS
jgi:hypothetical protein